MKKMVIIILCFQAFTVFPCSIFTYQNETGTYFCGNEDWGAKDPAMFTIKASGNEYGVVLLGWKSYLPNYPQAGINSEGLCFDWATVPAQQYTPIKGKRDLSINATIEILKKCKTIDDVIAYISDYNFSHIAAEHILFADKAGMSCVIEYTKGERRIIKKNTSQCITNFNLSDKESGWYPCQRYEKLSLGLNTDNLGYNDLTNLLDGVHQEGNYPTIYSYIMNLTTMEISVFYNHHFNTAKKYRVEELLKKNQIISIR